MIALLQRVSRAAVRVRMRTVAEIGPGLLILLGVERGDGEAEAEKLEARVAAYRVFADADGKMNLSLHDVQGQVLVVPQFTLAADTGRGLRPSFAAAAEAGQGRRLFDLFVERARARHGADRVGAGVFGAHMQVELVNDGPVTFWLRTPPQSD